MRAMASAPESTKAFNDLIDLLGEIRDNYVLASDRFTDELDIVEGYRYVTQLLSENCASVAAATTSTTRTT